MDMKQALNRIASNLDLSRDEMKDVMRIVMNGEATDAQIGAFLMGLRLKSETIDEITGATEVMRELATKVSINASPLVDIVGTGGDGANLFNVSSASSFVVAAAGGFVAKHGNRGVSSKSGSADLIEKAGINLDMKPEEVARCVEQIGVGFMFAPAHHGAMKHAIGPRRELGCRTIFNILGPMTNPAGVTRQLIGVFTRELCRPMAEVMQRLGAEHIMVVCSKDGLDEIIRRRSLQKFREFPGKRAHLPDRSERHGADLGPFSLQIDDSHGFFVSCLVEPESERCAGVTNMARADFLRLVQMS